MRHRIGLLQRLRRGVPGARVPAPPADVSAPPSAGRARAPDAAIERRAPANLLQAEAEARYQRDRLALYNARMLTGRPASATRLEELRRLSAAADARLAHAKER